MSLGLVPLKGRFRWLPNCAKMLIAIVKHTRTYGPTHAHTPANIHTRASRCASCAAPLYYTICASVQKNISYVILGVHL